MTEPVTAGAVRVMPRGSTAITDGWSVPRPVAKARAVLKKSLAAASAGALLTATPAYSGIMVNNG